MKAQPFREKVVVFIALKNQASHGHKEDNHCLQPLTR